MKLTECLHEAYGVARRLETLDEQPGSLLPEGAKLLDVDAARYVDSACRNLAPWGSA